MVEFTYLKCNYFFLRIGLPHEMHLELNWKKARYKAKISKSFISCDILWKRNIIWEVVIWLFSNITFHWLIYLNLWSGTSYNFIGIGYCTTTITICCLFSLIMQCHLKTIWNNSLEEKYFSCMALLSRR